jgi:nicotinamidase-related amidase
MKPETTAIVLIGYQNDYFADDGILNAVIEESSRVNRTLENTVAFLSAVDESKVTLVSTPIIFTEDYRELDNPVGILAAIREAKAFQAGRSGAETIEELSRFPRMVEVPGKRGLNAFSNTDLDQLLRQCGIEDIVLAGAVTSICIDSTGRSAHERGYRVHILSDCTSARTNFEQEFYCEQIFPLYAQVLDHKALLGKFGLREVEASPKQAAS